LNNAVTLQEYGMKTLDVEDAIISLLCSDLLTQLYIDHKISIDDYKSNCIRCKCCPSDVLNRTIEKPSTTTLLDTQLLNELDNLGSKDMLWICRESSTGRGLRVHQDPLYGKFNSIREAITHYILSKNK
jgi:hypothetical protein